MEAVAAVLAEMELIITVLYTNGGSFGAVRITFTAIQTQLAKIAHFHFAVGSAAIRTEVVVPIGIFYTVFAAGAALGSGIIHTAEHAQTTIITQVDTVLVKTFLALLTNDTAFFTVQIFILTDFIGAVAVAARFAVHQLQLPATLAEAASIAQSAHAVSAEPTATAQFIF